MAAALARANQNEGHLATALSLAQQAQAAARAAAAAMNGGSPTASRPAACRLLPTSPPPRRTRSACTPGRAPTCRPAIRTIPTMSPSSRRSSRRCSPGPRSTSASRPPSPSSSSRAGWCSTGSSASSTRRPVCASLARRRPPARSSAAIKGAGTVLVINQNGILFSPTAQINVDSLIATSLEIGAALRRTSHPGISASARPTSGSCSGGLLGSLQGYATPVTFSAQATGYDSNGQPTFDPLIEGPVEVATGATITTGASGSALLIAPTIVNGGQITSPNGQISLISGRSVTFTPSQRRRQQRRSQPARRADQPRAMSARFTGDYVDNQANSLLAAPGGYTSLQATIDWRGAPRRGHRRDHQRVAERLCQPARRRHRARARRGDRHHARRRAGDHPAERHLGAGLQDLGDPHRRHRRQHRYRRQQPRSMRRAANISIGADPGQVGFGASPTSTARVFVDDGAVIDAAGVPNVQVPASSC